MVLLTSKELATGEENATHVFGRYFAPNETSWLTANWNITKHFPGYKLQTGAGAKMQQD